MNVSMNYFTSEIDMPGTHPDWQERMHLLSTASLNRILVAAGTDSGSIVGYDEPIHHFKGDSQLKAESIPPLDRILEETVRFVLRASSRGLYTNRRFEQSNAIKAVENLMPFADDYRYGLAAASDDTTYLAAKGLLDTQLSGRTDSSVEFNRFLAESIRLAYLSGRIAQTR